MPKQPVSTRRARPTPFPDRAQGAPSAKAEAYSGKISLRWECPPSLPVLLAWFAEAGISVSEKLKIQPMEEGRGWGVVATEVGIPLEVVSRIPRSAILSVNTSTFKAIVPSKTWRQIPPIAQLSLTLLYEIRLGSMSRHYGYLQSLPRDHVPIAALWGFEELFGEDGINGLKILAGTEMEREIKRFAKEERSNDEMETYWKFTQEYYPRTEFAPAPPTFFDLMYAYSLVTSRAFQVDVYHGSAMVPLADLFNHREDNHVCFESDDFVCEECGSLQACEHDDPADPSSTIPYRLQHLPLQIIESYTNPAQNTVDLTVKMPIAPGEEVFNTYGEGISWAKMLSEWGFIDETGEALGRGITWELKEVLVEERQDYEARRKIWKALCNRPAEDGWTDESLIFDPAQDVDQHAPKDSLLINSDGQVSTPLFWACYANCLGAGDIEDNSREALVHIGNELRSRIEARARGELELTGEKDDYTQAVSNTLLGFVRAKLSRMWRAEWSSERLCDYLDSLSEPENIQRMALKLAIEERRVLEVVEQRWAPS